MKSKNLKKTAEVVGFGYFTSNPRRKWIDGRITLDIDGIERDATIRLDCVHSSQKHLIKQGAHFKIKTNCRIIINRYKKITKKELEKIKLDAKRLAALLEGI